MTSKLAERVGKKLFEKHIQSYTPVDPLYENYTDAKGRQKRRRVSETSSISCFSVVKLNQGLFFQRQSPPGLSARDAKILKSVQKRAHYLDKGFGVCGIRFGWTFIIGAFDSSCLSDLRWKGHGKPLCDPRGRHMTKM